jgi:hypothetical protein
MKTSLKIFWIFPWLLSVDLGAFGILIATSPKWGQGAWLWTIGFMVANMIPVIVLADSFQKYWNKNKIDNR